MKLTPDRTGKIPHGESIKVRLPQNTICDLRTFSLFYKGTAVSSSDGNVHFPRPSSSIIKPVLSSKVHFPRLSSSIIKTLGVCVNGTLIERTDNYNTLYNKLYDFFQQGDFYKSGLDGKSPALDIAWKMFLGVMLVQPSSLSL